MRPYFPPVAQTSTYIMLISSGNEWKIRKVPSLRLFTPFSQTFSKLELWYSWTESIPITLELMEPVPVNTEKKKNFIANVTSLRQNNDQIINNKHVCSWEFSLLRQPFSLRCCLGVFRYVTKEEEMLNRNQLTLNNFHVCHTSGWISEIVLEIGNEKVFRFSDDSDTIPPSYEWYDSHHKIVSKIGCGTGKQILTTDTPHQFSKIRKVLSSP